MRLKKYRDKRNFNITSEPDQPQKKSKNKFVYVIQKHAARHLHYDLRLEMHGVLKSWAIPKGPSLDPKVKRLAIEVEDHPLAYSDFEGTIPPGEYGAGTVVIWDKGHWQPAGNYDAAYRKGDITFEIQGKKLGGLWKLIKIKSAESDRSKPWLFFKLQDKYSNKNKDVLKSKPEHVALKSTKKKPQPRTFAPQLANLSPSIPSGKDWLHEVKFDGYRLLCFISPKGVRLLSRNGLDWTGKLKLLAKKLESFPDKNVILDGEIITKDKKGISNFQDLQTALKEKKIASISYMVFDLPYYQGHPLDKTPLIERKKILQQLFSQWKTPHVNIAYTDHIQGHGKAVLQQACRFGLEGIMSKQINSPYEHKRTSTWLKSKCKKQAEFIIGGYTKPQQSRKFFGALLLGYYNKKKQFIFCGHVGTGFNDIMLKDIFKKMKKLEQTRSSFYNSSTIENQKHTIWLKPQLLCSVAFQSWTKDSLLRQAVFLGLREDKTVKDLKLEPETILKTSIKSQSAANKIITSDYHLTHADRILYPTKDITKQALADYYDEVSDLILPHIIHRPLSLYRCPSNDEKGFYQKHHVKAFPKDIYPIDKFLMIKDKKGLMALVQFDVLEIHPWGSRIPNLDKPDRIILDLDPGPDLSWTILVQAALSCKAELEQLELTSFVKTTGGKGLHIVIPIRPTRFWNEIKAFTKAFALYMSEKYPSVFTATVSKSARQGKIYIDYLRNTKGSTAVAAYSTRAKEHAPISMPVDWKALPNTQASNQVTIDNFGSHLSKINTKDPWKGFFECRQSISKKMIS